MSGQDKLSIERMIKLLSHDEDYQFGWCDMEVWEAKAIAKKLRAAENLVNLLHTLPFCNDEEGGFVCLPKQCWKELLYGPQGIDSYERA